MARNNEVFKILVTANNKPVLPKNKPVDDLAIGQIGFFDADTNLSIDGTTNVTDFYMAVGKSTDGINMDRIKVSAGQVIQLKNVLAYSAQNAQDPLPMKFKLTGLKPICGKDYLIKLNITNERILRRNGFTPFTKIYNAVSNCCNDDCVKGCVVGDCVQVVSDLLDVIAADKDGIVTAKALAASNLTTATHGIAADIAAGAEVPSTDFTALEAFNSTAADADKICLDIEFTTVPIKVAEFCTINLGFFDPLQTTVVATLSKDFNCDAKIVVTQEAKYEVGSGRSLIQAEYVSGGFYGNPSEYRVNSSTGFPKHIKYDVDANTKYNQIHLTYDQESVSAWKEYKNNLATTIAIPTSDSITLTSVKSKLNAIMNKVGIKPV